MPEPELSLLFVRPLNQIGARYIVSGSVASILYGEPRLVVLDEPNSNLDSAGEEALLTTLSVLKAKRTTVVIVAHRPSILQNVDRMLALRANGTMDVFGSRADVMQNFANRAAARAASNIVPLAPGGTNA